MIRECVFFFGRHFFDLGKRTLTVFISVVVYKLWICLAVYNIVQGRLKLNGSMEKLRIRQRYCIEWIGLLDS
jgi:hypothetical protein